MRRAMMTMVTALGVTGLAGLSACEPVYDGFDCHVINETPSGASCSDRLIEVARGEALVVRVRPHSDSRADYEDVEVELRSGATGVLDVRPGVDGEFTLIGLTRAQATTEVWIDGELVDRVETRVVPARD